MVISPDIFFHFLYKKEPQENTKASKFKKAYNNLTYRGPVVDGKLRTY